MGVGGDKRGRRSGRGEREGERGVRGCQESKGRGEGRGVGEVEGGGVGKGGRRRGVRDEASKERWRRGWVWEVGESKRAARGGVGKSRGGRGG